MVKYFLSFGCSVSFCARCALKPYLVILLSAFSVLTLQNQDWHLNFSPFTPSTINL